MLIQRGKFQIEPSGKRVTYHDPCELGRGCGVYEEPRHVVAAAATLLPTQEERAKSLCCGFNLGNTSIDSNQQTPIRDAALRNLLEPNPDLIATACPMCKKALTHANNVTVEDIAEIVAKQLKK